MKEKEFIIILLIIYQNSNNSKYYISWYYNNMNFEYYDPININKAYIIHFKFKSTEEFVNKLKRGHIFRQF